MLKHDDLTMRCDGLHMLAKKLTAYPYTIEPNLGAIQIEGSSGPVNGEALRDMVWDMFHEDNARLYEVLCGWECVVGLMLKLVPFEDYVTKLILDSAADPPSLKTDEGAAKAENAKIAFQRTKRFLQKNDSELAERLFIALVDVNAPKKTANKKDQTRSPANRRKLTSHYLEWMDELVLPMVGMEPDLPPSSKEEAAAAREWLEGEDDNVACHWFESDAHLRQYLHHLLPLVSTSSSGSMVHAPLVSLVGHLRLVNPRLFETVAATFSSSMVAKISHALRIHIRVLPEYVTQAAPPPGEDDDLDEEEEEEEEEDEAPTDATDQSDSYSPIEDSKSHHYSPSEEENPLLDNEDVTTREMPTEPESPSPEQDSAKPVLAPKMQPSPDQPYEREAPVSLATYTSTIPTQPAADSLHPFNPTMEELQIPVAQRHPQNVRERGNT